MKQTRRSLFANIFGVLSTPALLAKYQEYPQYSPWAVLVRNYTADAKNFHFRTVRCPVEIKPPKFLYCKIETNSSKEFCFGALELYHSYAYRGVPGIKALVYRLPEAKEESTVSLFTIDVKDYKLQLS